MFAAIHGSNPFPAFIVVLVILGLQVFALMTAVRYWRQSNGSTSTSPSGPVDPAITELRLRFARSDIGEDEYARMAGLLGYPPPSVADEHLPIDSI